MIRGTTPTFKLQITDDQVNLLEARNVYATFKQRDKAITKSDEDIEVSAHEVDVFLSQEETLKFKPGTIAVQLNWTYVDGVRACSNIIYVDIGENLKPEVLE